MKIYHRDENYCIDEDSSLWWKFTTAMKIYHCYKIYSLRWKYVTVIKIHHWDENVLPWWIFIILMKIYHSDDNHYIDETLSLWGKFITVIKSITQMKIFQWDVIYNCNENLSLQWRWIMMMRIIACYENLSL